MLVIAALIAFQCPDGSPPPCRGNARPAAPAVALNDQTWLVLPFENRARAADAELIRQASVPQLYSEMSRWSGVRVIPDARVADLLQSLPPASRDQVGLEAARGLARRVGAGRVVLGGYLAAGGRANVTATVYDTRSGRELRVVRDPLAGYATTAALDSLNTSFSRLARSILNLPEAGRTTRGGAGTQSLEAYREYVAGMAAFNRFQLDQASQHFNRAVIADSNFAMARLMRFRLATDSVAGRADLMAAVRLADNLPVRERTIVEALHAAIRLDRETACAAAHRLVELDSSDAEGWTSLTSCYLNATLIEDGGTVRITGDLNRALRSAERAYALSPDLLQSQIVLLNALQVGSSVQCVQRGVAICPPEHYYRVSVVPSGDSLAVLINRWHEVRHAPPDLTPAACAAQNARYERASRLAQRIAGNSDSHLMYQVAGQFALAAGDTARARDMLGRGTRSYVDTLPLQIRVRLGTMFELALARGHAADLQMWADSLFAHPNTAGQYRSMMGRLAEGGDTSAAGRQNARWRRILVGVYSPAHDTLERQMAERLTGPQRDDFLQLTTLAGFHARRTGPALDTAARHPLKRFQAWFARQDLSRARAALQEFDRELLARHPATPDDGGWLFSAESHLELGDTATAFARMREFGRRWPSLIPGAYILEMRYFQSTTPRLWGRAWLLYGDLAMARRESADARRAYGMVLALWDRGDDVVQPFVTRARTALASLGN